ncbi:ABC transporter permease [Pontibacter sp. JH31]|uniref:ABC transporter permease n=1 Tax=Pontibacter aquaedesilientis TaxID=2766980 RepID=A0ABR7XC65_9BACT|nr:ABC transporter permease [Pontibacter aquaedesilientis]MBD1395885.1 ABC transporter permease [Pontibacter aquaedesilientis]
MGPYLLKRLLLVIPALWLIASLVFLLSKLMPGTYGSQQLQQSDAGYYSKGDPESREKAFRQYLRKTGQDLPLFYFSVTSLPEPDTLHLIYPETERLFLKRMAWLYGDWTLVSAFYSSLQQLEGSLTATERKSIQPHMHALYQHTRSEQLSSAVDSIASTLAASTDPLRRLQASTHTLLDTREEYAYVLPDFRWHGPDNQYHHWMRHLFEGELGTSYRDGRPVVALLVEAIGNTWWLMFISMGLATLISLELAMLMVRRHGRIWRRSVLPALFFLDSIPLFVLAMLLLVLLASPAFLQLFPVYGMGYYTEVSLSWLQAMNQWLLFMALPMVCLVLANLPYLTNQFYHALAGTASQDYTRTARAKGLSESGVIRRHMLRNALLPIITLLSDFLPALVAGAVIIETIFAIPGIGRLLIDSVMARDYPVMVGIVVLVALFKLLAHLLSDLLYALADPRIRHTAA